MVDIVWHIYSRFNLFVKCVQCPPVHSKAKLFSNFFTLLIIEFSACPNCLIWRLSVNCYDIELADKLYKPINMLLYFFTPWNFFIIGWEQVQLRTTAIINIRSRPLSHRNQAQGKTYTFPVQIFWTGWKNFELSSPYFWNYKVKSNIGER